MTGQWLFTFHSCEQMCNWSSARKKRPRRPRNKASKDLLLLLIAEDLLPTAPWAQSRDCHMSWHKIPRIRLNRSPKTARKSATRMRMMWHFLIPPPLPARLPASNILRKYYCRSKRITGKTHLCIDLYKYSHHNICNNSCPSSPGRPPGSQTT